VYSSANTEEIESRLICNYNERGRTSDAQENLMKLVRIWWRISVRVKVTIQGQDALQCFRA